MTSQTAIPRAEAHVAAHDHVFLIGRPPVSEFIGFVRAMAVDGQNSDEGALAAEWRMANSRVREIESSESGVADNPVIEELPADLRPLADEVQSRETFRRSFELLPTRLGIVDLDRIVVFQKFIDLDYAALVAGGLGTSPSLHSIFRLAMGLDREDPLARAMQTGPNSYAFISPSNDFRVLGHHLLAPEQVTGAGFGGTPTAWVCLAVGYGSNFLNVLEIEGRLILNNGSHRAYALRKSGVSAAPCVIQTIGTRDELDLAGSADLKQNPDRYLKAVRPPMLRDYFDPALTRVVSVQRKNRLVKVSFGFEQSDMPA